MRVSSDPAAVADMLVLLADLCVRRCAERENVPDTETALAAVKLAAALRAASRRGDVVSSGTIEEPDPPSLDLRPVLSSVASGAAGVLVLLPKDALIMLAGGGGEDCTLLDGLRHAMACAVRSLGAPLEMECPEDLAAVCVLEPSPDWALDDWLRPPDPAELPAVVYRLLYDVLQLQSLQDTAPPAGGCGGGDGCQPAAGHTIHKDLFGVQDNGARVRSGNGGGREGCCAQVMGRGGYIQLLLPLAHTPVFLKPPTSQVVWPGGQGPHLHAAARRCVHFCMTAGHHHPPLLPGTAHLRRHVQPFCDRQSAAAPRPPSPGALAARLWRARAGHHICAWRVAGGVLLACMWCGGCSAVGCGRLCPACFPPSPFLAGNMCLLQGRGRGRRP